MELVMKPNGAVVFDGMAVGRFDREDHRLTLDLGWCELAGLRVTILGNTKIDRRRVVLQRPQDPKVLEGGDQLSINDAAGVQMAGSVTDHTVTTEG